MFYCELGKHISRPGDKMHKVVTIKRDRRYESVEYKDKYDKKHMSNDGQPTYGWEAVREICVCADHLTMSIQGKPSLYGSYKT